MAEATSGVSLGKTHLQVNPAAGQGLNGGIPEAAPHDGVAYLTENGYMKNQSSSKKSKAGQVSKFPSGSQTYLSPLPLPTGLPISTWEALRAYMEYEVNSLEEIQVSQELQKPGDPPWEGVHTFYNARERMRQRRKQGDVSWSYPFFWYCYHLLTLWTLPNHLTEWEVRKVQRLNRRATPESMQQWSEPLPQDQWAKPSDELKRQSSRVLELQKAHPGKSTLEIFALVSEEANAEGTMTA